MDKMKLLKSTVITVRQTLLTSQSTLIITLKYLYPVVILRKITEHKSSVTKFKRIHEEYDTRKYFSHGLTKLSYLPWFECINSAEFICIVRKIIQYTSAHSTATYFAK